MKHIILCADDYGQNTSISQAIIELISIKRLSATSCMTNSYYWLTHAQWLKPFEDQIDIGLHFNLTEGESLTKSPSFDQVSLSDLILKAYLQQLNKVEIEAELHAQIDQFEAGIGRSPDFIDGHQHIHQLPVIRDVILSVYDKRLRFSRCYIRCVNNPAALLRVTASGYVKTCIVQLLGSFTFKRALMKRQIPHNSSFSGFYDFGDAKKYPSLFPQFVKQVADQGLIMCHPGGVATVSKDAIADSRTQELDYFKSDAFSEYCLSNQMTLGRFK